MGISIKAYDDGSNIYGLIQLKLQSTSQQSTSQQSSIEQQQNNKVQIAVEVTPEQPFNNTQQPQQKERDTFLLDSNSAHIICDNYGFVSRLSAAAEKLFAYSNDLLIGSSVRILFPGLDEMDSLDLRENFANLRDQHIQGYVLAATSQGESRYLDVKLFACADSKDELVIVCSDWTHASQQADD